MDHRLSTRINEETYRKLAERSRLERKTESVIVREALEAHLPGAESLHESLTRIGGLGVAKGLPRDLSANRRYMEEFGRDDSPSFDRHGTPRRAPRR